MALVWARSGSDFSTTEAWPILPSDLDRSVDPEITFTRGDQTIDIVSGAVDRQGHLINVDYLIYTSPAILAEFDVWRVDGPELQAQATVAQALTLMLAGDDRINGSPDDDTLLGFGGGDDLKGHGGDDSLVGGDGWNQLYGGPGNDTLVTGGFRNYIDGGSGSDTMIGGEGEDYYDVTSARDVVIETGTASFDGVRASRVNWTLGPGLEQLTLGGREPLHGFGNSLDNVMKCNYGSHRLDGRAGADTLVGADGDDTLVGGAGADSMEGREGADRYDVGSQLDRIYEPGNSTDTDTIFATITLSLGGPVVARGTVENLRLTGSAAIDATGGSGANKLSGNGAANLLVGLAGNDTLVGGAGADTLRGGAGDDAFIGGPGNDVLQGGVGSDTFRISFALDAATNVDHVRDFDPRSDRFVLDDAAFAGIGPLGRLAAAAFHLGGAAGDAGDRVIYDAATGRLWFDADGSGAGAAVQFASVTPGTALTAHDFVIG
jgi:serralysin